MKKQNATFEAVNSIDVVFYTIALNRHPNLNDIRLPSN